MTSGSAELELRFIHGPDAGRTVQVRLASDVAVTLGRSDACDVTLGPSSASRRHCQLGLTGGRLEVVDLGSVHGTFADGEAVLGTARIVPPTILRLGEHLIQVVLRSPLPAAETPPASREDIGQPRASGQIIGARPDDPGSGWELLERVGQGAWSDVYRARRVGDGRPAALKVLRPERCADGLARFAREVRILRQLAHPHLAAILDDGRWGVSRYLACEWVDGESLTAWLARTERLPVAVARRLFGQLASALACAATREILHRDVCPNNILLSTGPEGALDAHLIDFGLGTQVGERQLTATGEGFGTFGYLAPEQLLGARDVDVRADVYALGATVFHMLAGRPPYRQTTALRLMRGMSAGPPPSVLELRADTGPGLAAIVTRCLAGLPERRYAGPGEIEAALAALPERDV